MLDWYLFTDDFESFENHEPSLKAAWWPSEHAEFDRPIAYLGLLGSAIGFTAYYNGVRAIGLARASVFINGVPICAILLAALLLREPITPTLAIGALLVVAGVTCTNR